MEENCIFCKIIKGEIPSSKIYEDEFTYAFLDISGDFYGHTLVVPKQHYENVLDCGSSVLQTVTNSVQKIAKHYVNNCGFTGVNIFNNSGTSAEQSVMHLHFHIVPRVGDDGYKVSPQNKAQTFDMQQIKSKLELK